MFVVDHKCREKNAFLVRFWSSICVLGKIVLFCRFDGSVTKIEYWRSSSDEQQVSRSKPYHDLKPLDRWVCWAGSVQLKVGPLC